MTTARVVAAELVGTFFLVLIGPGAVMVNAWSGGALGQTGIALAFAFVVTAMIQVFGSVSGAHINPAVTVALAWRGHFSRSLVIPHVAAQCAGAIAASLTLRAILGRVGSLGATIPAVPVPAAFGLEALMSFALMLVILACIRRPSALAPLAIGITVGFCALVGGPLTGASMNPARSLGPAVAGGTWAAHWLYWLAPTLGMLAADVLDRYLEAPLDT